MMALLLILVVIFISLCLFYKAYKNTKDIAVNHVEVVLADRHADVSSLRILHLSDLHLENISITPDALYDRLKDQQIDLIALTGDFLDRKRTIPKLVPYLKALQNLQATYGIYAVFGNHDYVLDEDDFQVLKKTMQAGGCRTLQNEHVTIEVNGRRLNIIGIDDYSTKRNDVAAAYAGIEEGLNLVLTHDPNIVLDMKHTNYDYLLAGHFHGGQIHWPKPYHLRKMGKLARMNIVKGLHAYHGKRFYISEGLGQTGVNIRVGSRPEMTFHNLVFSSKAKSEKSAV